MLINVVFGLEHSFQLTNGDGHEDPISGRRTGHLAFGVMKDAMMRKPIFHEAGGVRVGGGEGVNLCLREVLPVP